METNTYSCENCGKTLGGDNPPAYMCQVCVELKDVPYCGPACENAHMSQHARDCGLPPCELETFRPRLPDIDPTIMTELFIGSYRSPLSDSHTSITKRVKVYGGKCSSMTAILVIRIEEVNGKAIEWSTDWMRLSVYKREHGELWDKYKLQPSTGNGFGDRLRHDDGSVVAGAVNRLCEPDGGLKDAFIRQHCKEKLEVVGNLELPL